MDEPALVTESCNLSEWSLSREMSGENFRLEADIERIGIFNCQLQQVSLGPLPCTQDPSHHPFVPEGPQGNFLLRIVLRFLGFSGDFWNQVKGMKETEVPDRGMSVYLFAK